MTGLKKTQKGQYNTTNVDYILSGFEDKVAGKDVIDSFCGKKDLLNWAEKHGALSTFGTDIDEALEEPDDYVDSFADPYEYDNYFILMNPPYLAKNKAIDKSVYAQYDTDDLYKAAIQSILSSKEGILIIPVNFLSSKEFKTRKMFLQKFKITKCKLFEEQVFKDTSSTVIAFHYEIGTNEEFVLTCTPSLETYKIFLNPKHNYLFGEDFFDFISTGKDVKVKRLLIGDETPQASLYLNALDGGSEHNRINLSYNEEHYYGKQTDRSKASIVIPDHTLSVEEQKKLCNSFNTLLEEYRLKYKSLFLSNYRESSSLYARKRIGFTQAYQLIGACLKNIS
jgi:hypothetical protein